MQDFTYDIPTKVLFGRDSLSRLPECARKFGTRVMLVYGGGSIRRTGLYDRVRGLLEENGFRCTELGGVEPNPRLSTVKKGVAIAREHHVEAVIPIGGGSAIDCAKAIAAAAAYDGDPWDLVEDGSLIREILPILAIPTMAATGSEMDPYAVITNEQLQLKRDLSSPALYPAYALLNPELTYTVPPYQTACGVTDILAHIMEVYFAKGYGTYLQDRLMEGMMKTLIHYGPIAVQEPEDYDARANILWASEWAINGMIACGREGPWPAHSIEHQLSARFDVTHGHGLAIVIPKLMETMCGEDAIARLAEYGRNVWMLDTSLTDSRAARKAIVRTTEFYESLGLTTTLDSLGIALTEQDITEMAAVAASEGLEDCLSPLTAADVEAVYRNCL